VSRGKKPSKKATPKRIERQLRVPWNELTPEEQRNVEGLLREEKRWREQEKARCGDFDWAQARRELDRAIATRDRLIPSPRTAEQGKAKAKPGSAAAWIDELHPNDWHLVSAGKICQEAGRHGSNLTVRAFQHALAKKRKG
jgi:hypothetical protein